MARLPFNWDCIFYISQHRSTWLIWVFKFFNFWANYDRRYYTEGALLLIFIVYWFYNRQYAVTVLSLFLLSSYLTAIAKILIGNPRPFYSSQYDTYSTPSSQVANNTVFWGFVFQKHSHFISRFGAVVMIIIVALARPYLGVSYVEDSIISITIGIVLLSVYFSNTDKFSELSYDDKLLVTTVVYTISTAILLVQYSISSHTRVFITSAGLILGCYIGYSLVSDNNLVFSSNSQQFVFALFGFGVLACTLIGSGEIQKQYFQRFSNWWGVIQYIRYCLLGVMGFGVLPRVYTKIQQNICFSLIVDRY